MDLDHRTKPGSPGDILEHYGVKGMRWGIRKKEERVGRDGATADSSAKVGPKPDAETQRMISRVTRTDTPQTVTSGGRVTAAPGRQDAPNVQGYKKGLTREQKIALTFGAVAVGAAGYYAYSKYSGPFMEGIQEGRKLRDQVRDQADIDKITGMKLPDSWDTSGLKHGPISKQRLGDLAGNVKDWQLIDPDSLVINTSRGYADILPKDGLDLPFAREQHASAIRVLEEMREKYPAIRNMNIEVIPMSRVPGVGDSGAQMCVQAMRAGEARLMYNDMIDAPSAATIRANAHFLPGLAKKDYVAYHEMGHLLASASGDLPETGSLFTGSMIERNRAFAQWQKVEPILHKKRFAKHGFSYRELQKISGYAATQPAEAMAELIGHYHHPEMRKRLTADQIRRAEAMINEMGGLTG